MSFFNELKNTVDPQKKRKTTTKRTKTITSLSPRASVFSKLSMEDIYKCIDYNVNREYKDLDVSIEEEKKEEMGFFGYIIDKIRKLFKWINEKLQAFWDMITGLFSNKKNKEKQEENKKLIKENKEEIKEIQENINEAIKDTNGIPPEPEGEVKKGERIVKAKEKFVNIVHKLKNKTTNIKNKIKDEISERRVISKLDYTTLLYLYYFNGNGSMPKNTLTNITNLLKDYEGYIDKTFNSIIEILNDVKEEKDINELYNKYNIKSQDIKELAKEMVLSNLEDVIGSDKVKRSENSNERKKGYQIGDYLRVIFYLENGPGIIFDRGVKTKITKLPFINNQQWLNDAIDNVSNFSNISSEINKFKINMKKQQERVDGTLGKVVKIKSNFNKMLKLKVMVANELSNLLKNASINYSRTVTEFVQYSKHLNDFIDVVTEPLTKLK